MPGVKPPGTARAKGEKSRIYTEIRQKIDKMNRDQWREWFKECIDELQKDPELWQWINHKGKWEGMFKDGKYQNKKTGAGRPKDWYEGINYPDTRNRYNEL